MSKTIYIKLKSSSIKAGPFKVTNAQNGDVIDALVTKNELIVGRGYSVANDVTIVSIESLGKCKRLFQSV